MVGPRGVLRRALFSRGVGARLVAVRGLLYMIVQQLRTMEEGEGGGDSDEALEADPELSLSQVPYCTHIHSFNYNYPQNTALMLDSCFQDGRTPCDDSLPSVMFLLCRIHIAMPNVRNSNFSAASMPDTR